MLLLTYLFIYLLTYRSQVTSKKRNSQSYRNKKDGYRQQNVRQRQKLISIIDYDFCMTFY